MQDGQVAGEFVPDREEEDLVDFEYDDSPASDSDAEDNPAAADAADKGGMHDSSFERFLDEWSDDDSTSKIGGSGADSHPNPKKAPLKRPRADGPSTGAAPSKSAKTTVAAPRGKATQTGRTRVQPAGKVPGAKPKVGPVLKGIPLDIPPLRFRMPRGAPMTAG